MDISKGRYWDKPWSLIDGCTPCSPGCEHCWAAAIKHRIGAKVTRHVFEAHIPSPFTNPDRKFNGKIKLHYDRLPIPLKRRKPTVYAVWNDLMHEDVPRKFIEQALTNMLACPQHTFLILTKRQERLSEISRLGHWPYRNVFIGLTICNQQEADEKIPVFLQVPGKKFLSIEPMLSDINIKVALEDGHPTKEQIDHPDALKAMHYIRYGAPRIDAVILGGETGPGARPMHPEWVRSIRDQCASAGVPFFFKSWGAWKPCDDDHVECKGHKSTAMRLSGEIVTDEDPCWKDKVFGGTDQGFWKAGSRAGRLLDRRTHDDLPWRNGRAE
jgi:protein gp37